MWDRENGSTASHWYRVRSHGAVPWPLWSHRSFTLPSPSLCPLRRFATRLLLHSWAQGPLLGIGACMHPSHDSVEHRHVPTRPLCIIFRFFIPFVGDKVCCRHLAADLEGLLDICRPAVQRSAHPFVDGLQIGLLLQDNEACAPRVRFCVCAFCQGLYRRDLEYDLSMTEKWQIANVHTKFSMPLSPCLDTCLKELHHRRRVHRLVTVFDKSTIAASCTHRQ